MLEQSYSHFLAAQNRVHDLHRQAADLTVKRAAKAERRRAAREAALAALKAEVAELERLASSTWQNQRRENFLESVGRLRGAR